MLGDLNHANLKIVLPRFHQHILFATRGENTDKAYTTLKRAYKASPLPHLGSSDHISVMLIPAYRPRVKLVRPVKKQVRVWSEESISAPQDCMEITDWNIFREAATLNDHTDLQEYTKTVLDYISKCVDDTTTTTKTITVHSNRKIWMTGEVQSLLKS